MEDGVRGCDYRIPLEELSEQAKSLGVWGLVWRINEAPGKVLLSLLRKGQIHGVKWSLSSVILGSLFYLTNFGLGHQVVIIQ